MIKSKSNQKGVALVVSLIILVSLTMLGLTSIQRTTTDLTMAGNQRETGLMFQAAEIGLANAEQYVVNANSVTDFSNASQGLLTVKGRELDPSYFGPDYYDKNTWTNASTMTGTSLNVLEQPRYMIEYLGERCNNCNALINIGGGYGGEQTGDISSVFRSTARGVGLTGNSFRYVQSYFGRDKL